MNSRIPSLQKEVAKEEQLLEQELGVAKRSRKTYANYHPLPYTLSISICESLHNATKIDGEHVIDDWSASYMLHAGSLHPYDVQMSDTFDEAGFGAAKNPFMYCALCTRCFLRCLYSHGAGDPNIRPIRRQDAEAS